MLPTDDNFRVTEIFAEPEPEPEFEGTDSLAARMYRRSQQRQWCAGDLPWHWGVKLDEGRKAGGAEVLSQILYGEKASLRLVRQLAAMVEDPDERRFLQSQAEDEARHVEVFSRYIALLGEVQPPDQYLSQMIEVMLDSPALEVKVLGMHILIEGMALETFHAAAMQIDDPLLKELMRRVYRDESRHVAFGTEFARKTVAELGQAERDMLAWQGGRFAVAAVGLIRNQEAIATEFGLDLRLIQTRTQRVLFRRLADIGLLNLKSKI